MTVFALTWVKCHSAEGQKEKVAGSRLRVRGGEGRREERGGIREGMVEWELVVIREWARKRKSACSH